MEKELIFTPTTFFVEAPFYLVVGDTKAYTLVFHADAHVDGTMLITATRADGETVTDSVTFSGKVCRYTMCNAMYAAEGKLCVRVTVYTGDTVFTSNELYFKVLPAANAGTIEADDRYPILTKLLLQTEDAAQQAENALKTVLDTKTKLLPDSSLQDTGKILYLRKKKNTELQYFSVDLENQYEVVLDAGLLDAETAFLEIDSMAFSDAGLSDPTQESCALGLTFIPSNVDASTDYDVVTEEITASDNGYILAFPLSACPLMEDADTDSLFTLFESIQLNGEFLKEETEAVWANPEDALPGTFLDQYIISPTLSLAKKYADEKDSAVMADAKTKLDRRVPENSKASLSVLVSDGAQKQYSTEELLAFSASPYKDALFPNLTISGKLSIEPASDNKYLFFNPETGVQLTVRHYAALSFDDDQIKLEMICDEDLSSLTLSDFKQKYPYYRVYNESRWEYADAFLQPAADKANIAEQNAKNYADKTAAKTLEEANTYTRDMALALIDSFQSCDNRDDSIFTWSLCTRPFSTQECIHTLSVLDSGALFITGRFYLDLNETMVFYTPNQSCVICTVQDIYVMEENGLHELILQPNTPITAKSKEDFVNTYSLFGTYSNRYSWETKTSFLGDVETALDGILAIQESLIGGVAK